MKLEPKHVLHEAFLKLKSDLKNFIELSMQGNEKSFGEAIAAVSHKIESRCWLKKQCSEQQCPAYQNDSGRCWLIAGTMCGGEVQGKFAKKYESCLKCEVYREAVYNNPVTEVEEHLIILVHSLMAKQHELNELATTDFLTGLNNRRYFDICINEKIEEAKRSNHWLYIVMIDINDFKFINDNQGHLQGDYVLKEFAQVLKSVTRKSDMVVRFGGDEFVIISQDNKVDGHAANSLIKRITDRVSLWNEVNINTGVLLSLSIGVSILSEGHSLSSAMVAADNSMYADKARNKQTNQRGLL